jgi:hypothetical protein
VRAAASCPSEDGTRSLWGSLSIQGASQYVAVGCRVISILTPRYARSNPKLMAMRALYVIADIEAVKTCR